MSNIEDKIEAWVNANASDKTKVKELVEVAKEFAKDFALWKEHMVQQDEIGNYFSEIRIGVSRKNPINIHSLLDVYLEEKRLWNKKAYEIEVTDESQVELMQQAREGRLLLKAKRVEIEKTRVRLKEQSLLEGRFIDSLAKRLKEIIEPAEKHLEIQEKYAETKEQLRKAKLKIDRLALLNPYLTVLDLDAFDLSTMSEVAFTTILNGAKVAFEDYQKEQEKIRLEQEEMEKRANLYSERKMKLAPYSFFIVNEDDVVYSDTTEEEFQAIFERLKDRKQKDDDHKELLAKQNAELQKQVANTEKKVTILTKKSLEFESIASSNAKSYQSELEILKQQHTDMKIALETALNFIIPDQLRKIIENTLKSLK